MRWLAELRTLVRPQRPERAPPSIGERAPEIPGSGSHPRLIVFLRHVGCPFAEATVRELELWRRRLPALPVSIISQGDDRQLESWLQAIGAARLATGVAGPAGRVHADEQAFRAWRIPLTSAAHFLGPRSLVGVLRLARRGLRNRHPAGSRWLSAAAFVTDADGRIAWRHLPAHAGDLPDLAEAVCGLELLLVGGGGGGLGA